MTASQQIQWAEVQPILSGHPTQQVAFAQYVVNIGAIQGGVINLATTGERAGDLVRSCPDPPHILPRHISGFLDREKEQRVVGQALARDQVVDVHGPDGIGKTALISQMMHALLPSAFPDGIVYLSGRSQLCDDLLQDLFKCFYETAGGSHVKMRPNDVRRYLAGKRALIAIDDCDDLEEGGADLLSQAVPQSALLVAARQPQAWVGASVSLGCLPRAQAKALFERCWGQPLDQETDTLEAICSALGDLPLSIVKTACTAASRGVALGDVLHELESQAAATEPLERVFLVLGQHLSAAEHQVLSAIAAPGGDSVDLQAIAAIAALPAAKVSHHLARLMDLQWVHQERDRYRLDAALAPYLRQHEPDAATRARAAGYYGALVARLQAGLPDPDEANVISALRYYVRRRQWREVIQIARAIEPRLATRAHWEQWRRVLHDAAEAAHQIRDGATEAWAHNQLGVVALGAGDPIAARQFFQRALRGWLALGDHDGATVARWNLQVLLGPPPPHTRGDETAPSPAASPTPLVLTLVAATALLLLGLGLIARQVIGSATPVARAPAVQLTVTLPPATPTRLPPTPTVTVSPTVATPVLTVVTVVTVVTRVPRPVTVVPPRPQAWLNLTLAGGCGQTYPPGAVLGIRLQSNVNGTVVVYLRGPGGGRELLFRQPLSANRVASNTWPVPDQAGRWVLEGSLNNGQSTANCAFAVEPPSIRVWLENKGCNAAYSLDDEVKIAYRANVDGELSILLLDCYEDGYDCPVVSTTVTAGQSGQMDWWLPEAYGKWTLQANLNGAEAIDRCDFAILPPPSPPQIGETWFEIGKMAQIERECLDEVMVYAQVYDQEDGLARVELRTRPYGSDDNWSSVGMVLVENDTYSQRVVARGEPFLEYQIYAEDNRGASATSRTLPLDVTFCVTTEPPEVITTVPPEVVTTVPPEIVTTVPPTVTTAVPPDGTTGTPTATATNTPTATPSVPPDTPTAPPDIPTVPPVDTLTPTPVATPTATPLGALPALPAHASSLIVLTSFPPMCRQRRPASTSSGPTILSSRVTWYASRTGHEQDTLPWIDSADGL